MSHRVFVRRPRITVRVVHGRPESGTRIGAKGGAEGKVFKGTDDHGREVFSTIGPRVTEQRGARVPPASPRGGRYGQ